ncbi:MAG: hypothetical protein ACE14L_05315 [Terriglobales bacterium]
MSKQVIRAATLFLLLVASAFAGAQEEKNELGLLLGSIVSPDPKTAGSAPRNIDIGAGLSFQATYGRRIAGDTVAVYLEIPFVAMPNAGVSSSVTEVIEAYASLFVTPGVRVKFAPEGKLSPWLAAGGGYGNFEEGSRNQAGGAIASHNTHTGVLQFGGGVDVNTGVRLLVPLSLRAEVRDFYSASPAFNTAIDRKRQHNVVFSGGFVIHF